MPDLPNADDLSDHDVDVITHIVNDMRLDSWVDELEALGALPELAWLEAALEDMLTRVQVYKAIAVASAHGQLEEFRITIPSKDTDDS